MPCSASQARSLKLDDDPVLAGPRPLADLKLLLAVLAVEPLLPPSLLDRVAPLEEPRTRCIRSPPGVQQALPMPGFLPQYAPPPYSMAQNIQPSHAVTMPSAPSPEAPLPSNPAELPSPAPASLSLQQLEARVDRLYSIANSASDVVRASRVDTDETQQ